MGDACTGRFGSPESVIGLIPLVLPVIHRKVWLCDPLAVCFFSVICLMFSAGFAAYAVVRIAKPNFTMNDWQHQRYQSNDAFWAAESSSARITRKDEPKQPRPSE